MKKIIALVLFAVMLFAFVPAASAAVTPFTVEVLTETEAYWYAQQQPEYNNLAADTTFPDGTTNKQDLIGKGQDIAVTVGNPASISSEDNKEIKITLTGSYDKAQSYLYSGQSSYNQYGKVVKIPYAVYDGANPANEITSNAHVLLDGMANLNWLQDPSNLAKRFYYIDFPLTVEDKTITYWISYLNNLGRVKITVVWDNTDDNKTTPGVYPTLKVVGYDPDSAQYGNFTAAFEKQMSWDSKNKVDVNGRLTFSIAAYTDDDRIKIFEDARVAHESDVESVTRSLNRTEILELLLLAKNETIDDLDFFRINGNWYAKFTLSETVYVYSLENDTMDIRVKAFAEDGTAYAPGTILAIGNQRFEYYEDWDKYIGKSSKYINLAGDPTYLIDQDSCFAFSFPGITEFATDARGHADDEIYMLYQKKCSNFKLIFTSGKKLEDVTFDVYFRNVERTKSGLTLVQGNEVEMVVGTEDYLPYYLSDPFAMSIELSQEWKSTNSKIVEVKNSKTGYVKAVAPGTAYLYATDAAGDVQLFIVKVVAEATPVTPPTIEVPAYKNYTVTASRLNVRSGPGTNYKSLGMISRGTVIQGVEIEGSSWVMVNYGGVEAYCSGKYLAE